MRKIIASFIKYPIYSWIVIITLLIVGLMSAFSMKLSFFPEQTTRDIFVTVVYPGASPKEMEEGITVRIEEAVRSIVGIKEMNSTSSENYAMVRITTTGEYDIDETLMDVKNAVDGISSLPTNADRPIVYKERNKSMTLYLALFARDGEVDLRTLKKYAYLIEEDLRASGIISQLEITGFPNSEISIEVNEENLLRYRLTFDDVSNAVLSNNADFSAGFIKSPEEEILIRSRTRTVNPDEIAEIIIKGKPDGSLIRIRDVAVVKLRFEDVSMGFKINKKESISFVVQKLPEEDLKAISAFVNKYADEFNEKYSDVTLKVNFDFMSILTQRLNLLLKNGIFGLALVIFSLALLLRFFLSFWVAWGIPASFLAMFFFGGMFGLTINMISLFGMILVIGILVDDGIVIGENIFTHFQKGKSPRLAALDGTIEVMPAVITSVLTTIVAFTPLLFMKEGHMEMMKDVAIVIILSLTFSLFEAFFILPAHLSHRYVLKKKQNQNKLRKVRGLAEKSIDYMRNNIYGKVLNLTIKWRWISVFVPIGLLLITGGMLVGGVIQSTFFPAIQFDTFTVNMAFKPGSGEKMTNEYVEKFENIIWDLNKELQQVVGDTLPYIRTTVASLGMAFDGQEVGSHAGKIEVFFNDMDKRRLSSFKVANLVNERIGDVPELEKFTVGGRNRFGKPVSISLLGTNLDELNQAKEFMMNELKMLPSLKNITDNNPPGKQEIRLKLKPKAYFLGLNQASIVYQIRQGFFGGQAQRLQDGKDELRVYIRYPKSGKMDISQLETMKIKTAKGEFPLSELTDYEIIRGPVNIKRYNMSREIKIEADMTNEYDAVPPILEKINQDIIPELKHRFSGVKIIHQGQQKASKESANEMMGYFIIAFFVIFIIIIIHFKSTVQALLILMMIPLGWMGAMWGHGIEGLQISMLSAFGMVALTGVIINDAVVFLSKFNTLIKEGMLIKEAVYSAGMARFRAIVLTSVTTVLGLYPLILETSFQAQFLIPMAATLAYGVLFGTGFILIFFPALILVLNDIKGVAYRIWNGIKAEPEELETAMIYSKRKSD